MEPQVQEYHLYTVNIFHTAPQDSLWYPTVLFKAFHDIIEAYSCHNLLSSDPSLHLQLYLFSLPFSVIPLCPSLLPDTEFLVLPPLYSLPPHLQALDAPCNAFHITLQRTFLFIIDPHSHSQRELPATHYPRVQALWHQHSLIEFTSVSPA